MKKIYILIVLSLMPLSGMMYGMEHAIPEGKQEENEGVSFGLLGPELIEKIALYATSAVTLEQAYNNVIKFLIGIGLPGFLNDNVFIKKFVDTLYEKFITPADRLSDVEKEIYFDKALTLAASLKNNNYAIEKLYDQFITPADQLSDPDTDNNLHNSHDQVKIYVSSNEKKKNFDRALTLAASLKNNDLAFEKLKKWIEGVGNAEKRKALLNEQMVWNAKNNLLEKVAFLVENIDKNLVNAADNLAGYTALMFAAEGGYADVVKYLVEHGADLNTVDNVFQKTARVIAQQKGYEEIIAILDEAAQK